MRVEDLRQLAVFARDIELCKLFLIETASSTEDGMDGIEGILSQSHTSSSAKLGRISAWVI
jgi:hypothetical protein